MTEFRYAVEIKNLDPAWYQRFVYGGAEPYDVVPGLSDNVIHEQVRVVSARPVDSRLERWNGSMDPDHCTRSATAVEIAAYDALQAQDLADGDWLRAKWHAMTQATHELRANAGWTLEDYRARIAQLLKTGS